MFRLIQVLCKAKLYVVNNYFFEVRITYEIQKKIKDDGTFQFVPSFINMGYSPFNNILCNGVKGLNLPPHTFFWITRAVPDSNTWRLLLFEEVTSVSISRLKTEFAWKKILTIGF